MSLLEQTQECKNSIKIYTLILTEREELFKLTYNYERKINWPNVYILSVTAVALVFIIAFAYESYFKNEAAKSYEREIQTLENTYQELQEKYADKNNKLKIITDEYNDLLERSE